MSFIDLFFPKLCLGCGLWGAYLCPRCQKKLVRPYKEQCFYCKKSSLYGLTHPICLKNFNIDGTMSLYVYNGLLKKIIKNIKYRLAKEVARDFFNTIDYESISKLAFYNRLSPPIYIQPIPLSDRKLKERGFNQALLISNFLKKYVNYPVSDFLIKVKETKAQAEITSKLQRYQNLRGAFKINRISSNTLEGSRIILVDDVITSGSTATEAARTLKKAGCIKIYVLTLAKG